MIQIISRDYFLKSKIERKSSKKQINNDCFFSTIYRNSLRFNRCFIDYFEINKNSKLILAKEGGEIYIRITQEDNPDAFEFAKDFRQYFIRSITLVKYLLDFYQIANENENSFRFYISKTPTLFDKIKYYKIENVVETKTVKDKSKKNEDNYEKD